MKFESLSDKKEIPVFPDFVFFKNDIGDYLCKSYYRLKYDGVYYLNLVGGWINKKEVPYLNDDQIKLITVSRMLKDIQLITKEDVINDYIYCLNENRGFLKIKYAMVDPCQEEQYPDYYIPSFKIGVEI